jgi:hypothetical protein
MFAVMRLSAGEKSMGVTGEEGVVCSSGRLKKPSIKNHKGWMLQVRRRVSWLNQTLNSRSGLGLILF